MVAIVDLAGKLRETYRQEWAYLNTRITHHLEELVVGGPRAHIVVYNPYLHALASLVDEHIPNEPSEGIVLEYVYINMYMMARLAHIGYQ